MCAGLLACTTPESAQERELPIPVAAPLVETPARIADRTLRKTYKSYVGISIDQEGAARLTLADASEFAAAARVGREAWVMAARDGARISEPLRFTFVQAAAGPEELREAFRKMRDVLTLPSVVFLDLDEACGCIMVGILEAAAVSQVASFAAQQGVPQALVRTSITPKPMLMHSLRDSYRPTMAGVQIQNRDKLQCTIGLPTYSLDRSIYGFLNSSHCSPSSPVARAALHTTSQDTRFFQPGGNFLGFDGVAMGKTDPPLFDSNGDAECPVGRRCRYSDVTFAEYNQATLGIIGRVARPNSICTVRGTPCAVDVDRATDDIRLTGGVSGLVAGDIVDKVGRTSGWTRGRIFATDVNVRVFDIDGNDTGITLLGQTFVSATARLGDSGSPVFLFHQASGTGLFAGILWDGFRDPDQFVFSPIAGIERDLGGFVYNSLGLNGAFASNGIFYTGDVADEIDVVVERNVLPSNEVQFVLNAGPGVNQPKEIVLVEGAGAGRFTVAVGNNVRTANDGLYTYQLPGGRLEFRKQSGSSVVEVTRVPIDFLQGGTRLTFTWRRD
jgi:hypothetical protein